MSKETSGLFPNRLPSNPSQLKHIFGVRDGHLADTPKNKETISRVANDKTFYMGTDKWGNDWYVEPLKNGGQHWAEVRDGVIFEGGYNRSPKDWDPKTGLKKTTRPVKKPKPKIKTLGGKRR